MADVKWFKVVSDVFDDEKMLIIDALPCADSIIVIWFKLLAFAAKQNNSGVFMMNGRIPYTEEMLAAIFRRDVQKVRLAMQAFKDLEMVDIVNEVITIPNWNKHQNLDSYEQKKERDRQYQAKRRAAQKALIAKSSDVSDDCQTIPSSDVAVSEEEREEEKEKELHSFILSDGDDDVDGLSTDLSPKERVKRTYMGGTLGQGVVFLSEEQIEDLLEKLSVEEFDHYCEVIARMELSGKRYKKKTHYQAILDMAAKDRGVKKG